MKVLALFIGIWCSTLGALAQTDAVAQKLLASISQQYQSYHTAKVNFTLTGTDRQKHTTINQKGDLVVLPKSNKYRITMSDQVLISDGRLRWNILKEEQEVQLTNASETEGESITPATIFTFYKKGFKYASAKDDHLSGKALAVIDLTPEDSRKSFSKVRLRIDRSARQIYDIIVYDKSGGQYHYLIDNFRPNVEVTSKTFTFDKAAYPDMEIVDLR